MNCYKSYKDAHAAAEVAEQIYFEAGSIDNFVEFIEFESFCEENDLESRQNYVDNLPKETVSLFKKLEEFALPFWQNDFKNKFLNGNGSFSDWLQDCLEYALSL